jgi:hypothetical protein
MQGVYRAAVRRQTNEARPQFAVARTGQARDFALETARNVVMSVKGFVGRQPASPLAGEHSRRLGR